MADVRFYTLNTAGGTARLRQACLLTEQAYLAGERVLVWLNGSSQLSQFDQLLWTFGDRAFVPHEPLAAEPRQCVAPVQLYAGAALEPRIVEGGFDTLVNLRDTAVAEALRFGRVIEVIDAEPACRDAGRTRFRFYRDAGATPQHMAVDDND
jgi:DNA polymerase III subunit chi